MATVNSNYRFMSASTNVGNALVVKNSKGYLFSYDLGNNSASVDAYVRFYDSSSAPTTGSGTPIRTIYVPKGTRAWGMFHDPIFFAAGIAHTITGAAADSDTTAVGANQVTINLEYE
jgi:hypothetical protein